MEEIFEVRFANSEQDFIQNQGVNKGFTQIPHKVLYCFLLTSAEKHMYELVISFMYGEKRTCYPSYEKLMSVSGWSENTIKKYIKALEQKQLLKYINRPGTTNEYEVCELHRSTVIVHSEMLHKINQEYFKRMVGKFNALKDEYIEGELFNTVSLAINPLEYYEQVKNWFLSIEKEETEELPIEEINEEPQQPKRPLPKYFRISGEVTTISDLNEKKPKGKKSKNPHEVSLDGWNTHHFFSYYEEQYLKKMNLPMPEHKGDRHQLKALVERYSNEKLKERIDLFFSSNSFQPVKKNIYSFSSANIQAKLDNLLNFGQSNSYKTKGKQIDANEQSQLEQWMKDMGIEE